jgi:hypothetical protein
MKTPETKPFYLTSEFYLLVIAAINTIVISNPTDKKTLITDIMAGIYAVARGIAKSGSPYEGEGSEQQPTALPQAGNGDILPALPPPDAAGVKGVQQGEPPAARNMPGTLAPKLDTVREILTESPEIIEQLKGEGVLS